DFALECKNWIKSEGNTTTPTSKWLHKLGYYYKPIIKGIYWDGHERFEIVEDRKQFAG
ncbi:36127_t:CDS:2, partial [Racocetra persica]